MTDNANEMPTKEFAVNEAALTAWTNGTARAGAIALDLLLPFILLFEVARGANWKTMVQSTVGRTPEPEVILDETESAYRLRAFLPGAMKNSVVCAVEGRNLVLRATPEIRFTDGRAFSYVRQMPVDETYALPQDADAEALRWDFEGGVLCAVIPRLRLVNA